MKKIVLVLMCICAFPLCGNTQKRLKSINGYKISYDDEGRISSIFGLDISYYGNIIELGNWGKYYINNGLITQMNKNISYDYTDNYLTSYVTKNVSKSYYRYIGWKDGNAISFKEYEDDFLITDATISYNNEEAHPIVHALFNFAPAVYGDNTTWDLFQDGIGFFYQYGGKTTKNLVSKISTTDYYPNVQTFHYEYNYEYRRNADNDVIEVLVEDRGDVTVYKLEWEDDPLSAVHNVESDIIAHKEWYYINGIRAQQKQQKKLYISNGKKIIKR
ncbi:MAG: hypothetical protein IKI47_05405 [Prevotella sp.]|nr:hypothetical protein [Prevotella sp.]